MEKKIAIVLSEFNDFVTEKLLIGAQERLTELKIKNEKIDIFRVPGAVEIPLTAKLLAKKSQYAAIICLGAVILGETNHYDYVCDQVSQGCQRVMLEFDIPVIFGVLTTSTVGQAEDRAGGAHGNKGRDAVDAAMTMIALVESIAEAT